MWPQPIHHLIVISVAQRILQHLYNSAANGPSDVPLRFSFGWLVFYFILFWRALCVCVRLYTCGGVVVCLFLFCRRSRYFFSDNIINNNRFILQESIRAECRRPQTLYINNSTKLRIPGPHHFCTQTKEQNTIYGRKKKYCAPL